MSKPTEEGEVCIKRVLRYLRGRPVCQWRFPWQDMPTHLVGFSNSDWAGCVRTRRSTSGGGIALGQHLLTHWSRTQTCVALSSGEAELNAMLKTAAEGLSLQNLITEVGMQAGLHLLGDSSASHGTLNRLGSGRIKHLQTKQLWLQEKIYNIGGEDPQGEELGGSSYTRLEPSQRAPIYCDGNRVGGTGGELGTKARQYPELSFIHHPGRASAQASLQYHCL